MDLCKYKDIFGQPNKGVHSYRFLNIAIVDLIGTILISLLISRLIEKNIYVVFCILMLIGFILHVLFCVDTALVKMILG